MGFCIKVVLASSHLFGIASSSFSERVHVTQASPTPWVKVQGLMDFAETLRVKASFGAHPPHRIPAFASVWFLQIFSFCVSSAMHFKRFQNIFSPACDYLNQVVSYTVRNEHPHGYVPLITFHQPLIRRPHVYPSPPAMPTLADGRGSGISY